MCLSVAQPVLNLLLFILVASGPCVSVAEACRGSMRPDNPRLRPSANSLPDGLVASLEEAGFFAIDLYEDGRWAAWCWQCTGKGLPPTAAFTHVACEDAGRDALSMRPCTKLASAISHFKNCHGANPIPVVTAKRRKMDAVDTARASNSSAGYADPATPAMQTRERTSESHEGSPAPLPEGDWPDQQGSGRHGSTPDRVSSVALSEASRSVGSSEPPPAPPSPASLSGESAVGAFEEEAMPPPVAPAQARVGSGRWFFQNRLSKIAEGCSLSVLQVAYNIAELREQGVPKVATDVVCKLVKNVLVSIGAGEEDPQVPRVPPLRDVTVAPSTHLMEKVLGVRDASDFEFGWCSTCGLRFDQCKPAPTPDNPLHQLLSAGCPQCGTAMYKVLALYLTTCQLGASCHSCSGMT